MLEMVRKESKNKDEALNKCLEELNVSTSEVYYYFEETEGGLFKGKKYTAIVTTKYAIKDYIRDFLKDLSDKMGIKFNIEVTDNEYGFSVIIVADDSAYLIGKEGRTLNSIQNILRQSLKKFGNFDFRVNLDISNYKARKEKHLSYEIKKICKDVLKTGIDAKLDPMNSYERRIVHNVVGNFDSLYSESEGVNPNRYVVIKRKED